MEAKGYSARRAQLLAQAAGLRAEANRFRQAAILVADENVEEGLRARVRELENKARSVEARAAITIEPETSSETERDIAALKRPAERPKKP